MRHFLCLLLLSLSTMLNAQVHITGAMKNVMWKGHLQGTISLDTIAPRQHLYGLGPVEYLAGELLVLDGKAYQSTVVDKNSMKVKETFDVKAPFFGYAHISRWTAYNLPADITNMARLESYIDEITFNAKRPFMFRLTGTVQQATIHIVNLPKGIKVSSPDEAHRGQVSYQLADATCDILGFFSTEHQSILTHHDTYLHMHLITADRRQMGHLDKAEFGRDMKLYLPAE